MKTARLIGVGGVALSLGWAGCSAAAPANGSQGAGPWYVHVGPVAIVYDASANISLAGSQVPGASAKVDTSYSAAVELGYMFTKNIGASLTVGAPPTAYLRGTGPLDGLKLGAVSYGPSVFTVHYHFTNFGPRFQPYVGIGGNYTIVLHHKDGAVQNLHVDSPLGFALQGGVESAINSKWGLFVDVKQIWLSTNATGNVGPAPAQAHLTVNPLLVMGGVSYHF